jgi:hypothetical protein
MSRDLLIDDYRWPGQNSPPLTSAPDGQPWRSKITKSAGSPTVAGTAGAMKLSLDTTVEIQAAVLYMGDVLGYPIGKLVRVDFWASVSASLAAAVNVAFGMSAAQNNAPESSAEFALFRLVGSNELLISTSDGTNVTSQSDTGQTMGTQLIRCAMDFGSGLTSTAGSQATGGQSNVLFSMEQIAMPNSANPAPLLRRVCQTVRFNMSAYTGNLQPLAQIVKSSNAAAGSLSIYRARVAYKADFDG